MQNFLSPAIGLMNRLKYPGKFAVTGALAFVSVIILIASLATNLYDVIRLVRHELAVTEFIQPLNKQIQLTQQHRGISAAFLSGGTAMLKKLEDRQIEVDAALKTTDEVEMRHSVLLKSSAEWQAIKSDWLALRAGVMGMQTAETLEAHGQLIDRMLRFQVAVADAGGLSLDSEIDTYYLAETVVKSLPEMLERLGKMRAKGTGILVKKKLTDADRIEFSVHSILLRNTLRTLRLDLEKVARHSPAIAKRLEAFSTEIGEASALAVSLVDADIIGGKFSVAPQDFFDKFTQAIDIGYREMFDTLLPTLDQQLGARIHRLQTYLVLEVGLALFFLLLLTYVSLGAYHSIIDAVRKLSVGAGAIASGELTARIRLEGRDELNLVGDSFNAMAGALDKLLRTSRQTSDELAEALAEAKLADQTKDAFLANVSHELRTPLNAVIGFADLARRTGCPPEKQLDYLAKISDAGCTLSNVINDLLDLSKIAAGRMELDPVTFRLRALFARSRSIMSFKLAEKRLQLIDRIDDKVPDVLVGDNLRIEQLLLNLLSNAIKFTHKGRVELRISLYAHEAHRVCLLFEVEDSGIGMKEEEIARLFQPFSQADASMSRKYGGTGLGLALCKRLAEMMEGDIVVASQPGVGTTFGVRLWLGLGDANDVQEGVRLAREEVEQVSYQNARVLIVDDQPMNREIAQELLSSVGIVVSLAGNGQVALDILTEAGPAAFDLVLMDIQMPVMDGLTATRELRTRPEFKDLPIIAMTAHTMEHEKHLSSAAGLNDHIGKPFETANFYGVLAKWIPLTKQKIRHEIESEPAGSVPVACAALDTLAGVNVREGLARFGGKEERYRHWLADFVATAGAIPGQIRADLEVASVEQAAKKAHAFKGRVGMLGMTDLHRVVSALELALREAAPVDDLLSELAQSINQMQGALERVLDRGAGSRAGSVQTLQKIVWSEAYSVGVVELDDQHRRLISMINQLADFQRSSLAAGNANARDVSSAALHEILSDVFDYTRYHFKAEEDYLSRIGYPDTARHASQHAAFVEKISAFSIASSNGVLESVKMHRYLLEWLMDHILESDLHYGKFNRQEAPS
jgi:hemerythrin-like metal-binding protein